jgi:hypothetical protein
MKGRGAFLLIVATLAAIAVGCTDSPFGFDWDRTYPEELVVREDGVVRLTVDKNGVVSGAFTIGRGQRTGLLDVVFLDEDGAAIVPADDEYLEVTVTYPDIAEFQQGSPGAFRGRFQGLRVGETSVYFKYKRGEVGRGTGHWNSPAIALTVTP